MTKYKIIREYTVEAKNKAEAFEKMRNAENEIDVCFEFDEWIEKA